MKVDKICQLRPTELFNPQDPGLVSPARGWEWGAGSRLAPSCCLFMDLHGELILVLACLSLIKSWGTVGVGQMCDSSLPQGFRPVRAVGIPTFLLRQIWDKSEIS